MHITNQIERDSLEGRYTEILFWELAVVHYREKLFEIFVSNPVKCNLKIFFTVYRIENTNLKNGATGYLFIEK